MDQIDVEAVSVMRTLSRRVTVLLQTLLFSACATTAESSAVASDPFADRMVSFKPGANAGFGADRMPQIVFGPPQGAGAAAGSLDVVSLGNKGEIVLAFDDPAIIDGEGADFIVFENPFSGYVETGSVAVSEDGATWHEFPCAASDPSAIFKGCAGVAPVMSNPDNGIDATDSKSAGGDKFDLHDLGVMTARYVRIRDSGVNHYEGTSGGFDLDAVAIVHSAPLRSK